MLAPRPIASPLTAAITGSGHSRTAASLLGEARNISARGRPRPRRRLPVPRRHHPHSNACRRRRSPRSGSGSAANAEPQDPRTDAASRKSARVELLGAVERDDATAPSDSSRTESEAQGKLALGSGFINAL